MVVTLMASDAVDTPGIKHHPDDFLFLFFCVHFKILNKMVKYRSGCVSLERTLSDMNTMHTDLAIMDTCLVALDIVL